MSTPNRRTTDRPREHVRNGRSLAFLLLAVMALYGLLLLTWLS